MCVIFYRVRLVFCWRVYFVVGGDVGGWWWCWRFFFRVIRVIFVF